MCCWHLSHLSNRYQESGTATPGIGYSNTLNVFSSPFPEFGTGSCGQNELQFMPIISLNFFCKVTQTNAGPLPLSCSLGSCLCLQKEMPMSPRHCCLLLCWWQPTLKSLPTNRTPHVSKTSPLPPNPTMQNLPLFPGWQFASWKPLQGNFRCIVCNSGSDKPRLVLSSEIPPKESWAIPPWGPAHTCQAPQTEVALQSCLCLNMDLRSSGGWCRAGGSNISHWWCLQEKKAAVRCLQHFYTIKVPFFIIIIVLIEGMGLQLG